MTLEYKFLLLQYYIIHLLYWDRGENLIIGFPLKEMEAALARCFCTEIQKY